MDRAVPDAGPCRLARRQASGRRPTDGRRFWFVGQKFLPLGVDDDVTVHDDVRFQGEKRPLRPVERMFTGVLETDASRRQCDSHASPDELFEQLVHRKQQREPLLVSRGRVLPVPAKEQARKPVESMERAVGSIQEHPLPEWVRAVADEFETGGQLGELALVLRGTR